MTIPFVTVKTILIALGAVTLAFASLIIVEPSQATSAVPAPEQRSEGQGPADGKAAVSAGSKDVESAWQRVVNSAEHTLKSASEQSAAIRGVMQDLQTFAERYPGTEQSGAALLNRGGLAASLGDFPTADLALQQALKQTQNPRLLATINATIAELSMRPGGTPPAFTAKALDGRKISPADYKGKALLLDFWATWCPPCIAELPGIKRVYAKYHDQGFEIVSISLDRTEKTLRRFVEKQDMNWTHIYNAALPAGKNIATQYGVSTIPQMVLIGRDGTIAEVGLRGEALESAVQRALGATAISLANDRAVRPARAALGQLAPALAVQEWIRGKPTTLDDLKGKVVLLDIFQIICPGCHRAHPEIVRMQNRYADRGFEVLGLAVAFEYEAAQTPRLIRDYVTRKAYPYPVAIDQGLTDTFRRYRSRGTPFTVLIDRQGRIRHLDFFRLRRVESMVQRLLDEDPEG